MYQATKRGRGHGLGMRLSVCRKVYVISKLFIILQQNGGLGKDYAARPSFRIKLFFDSGYSLLP